MGVALGVAAVPGEAAVPREATAPREATVPVGAELRGAVDGAPGLGASTLDRGGVSEVVGGAPDLDPEPEPPAVPLGAAAEVELFFSSLGSLLGAPSGHSCNGNTGHSEGRLFS